MVQGCIHYTPWTDTDEIKRYGVEIIADEVVFLSKGKGATRADISEDDIPY
ncbi:hypothetical protein [Rhizorhabdus argentea]|uniref:hypothetical protein n=1 Tax=Rhizorhabdus argentea TaxID=1387174 RepID=UPI003BF46AB1